MSKAGIFESVFNQMNFSYHLVSCVFNFQSFREKILFKAQCIVLISFIIPLIKTIRLLKFYNIQQYEVMPAKRYTYFENIQFKIF